jgi:tetratricopeptide (TPR) repeat protein
MNQTKATQALITNLSSDTARWRVLERLVKDDMLDIESITDRDILERAMPMYQTHWKFGFGRSAEIALKLGNKELAEELFEKQISMLETSGDLADAAEVVLRTGNKPRAKFLFEKQIRAYESRGRCYYSYAAAVALRLGDSERAMTYYEMDDNFDKAAEVALGIGDKERAIQFHLKDAYGDYHFAQAGDIALSMGDTKRANELFEKQIEFCQSRPQRYAYRNIASYYGELVLKMGDKRRAMKYFKDVGEFEKAGELSLQLGDRDEAQIMFERQIQSYENAGEFERAAKLAEKLKYAERANGLRAIGSLLRSN